MLYKSNSTPSMYKLQSAKECNIEGKKNLKKNTVSDFLNVEETIEQLNKIRKFKKFRKNRSKYIKVSASANSDEYYEDYKKVNSNDNFSRKSTLSIKYALDTESNISPNLVQKLGLNFFPTCFSFMDFVNISSSVVVWYATSMSITALNKYVFDVLDFNYPLFVTFIHFSCISFILLILNYIPYFPLKTPKIIMRNYFLFILPTAILGSTEIAFSNLAYTEVSISVITVMKSLIAVITYMLSVIVGLEKFSWRLLSTVILIVSSISLTVPGMDIKNYLGIVYLTIAIFSAAGRWVIIHHQLRYSNFSPLQLMFLTQPLAGLCLAFPAFMIDIPNIARDYEEYANSEKFLTALGLTLIVVILAFIMIFAEYRFVTHTSSVTLTIAGVGKEMLTILMSIIAFNDKVNLKIFVGIGFSLVGILAYSRIRYQMIQEDFKKKLNENPKDSLSTIASNDLHDYEISRSSTSLNRISFMLEKEIQLPGNVSAEIIPIKIEEQV